MRPPPPVLWCQGVERSAYRYKGKLSNKCPAFSTNSGKSTDEGIVFRYNTSLAKETNVPSAELSAMIPVKNIACPVLLGCGTDDLNVDSAFTASYITEHIKAVGKDSLCTIVQFLRAGHMIDPPYPPLCHSSYSYRFKMYLVWGGEPKSHALAQEIYWDKLLGFLHQSLPQNLNSKL